MKIEVSEYVLSRIEMDRRHFEEMIGGGSWSIDDTLTEWIKILDSIAGTRRHRK